MKHVPLSCHISEAQLKNTIKECTRREAGVSVLFDRNLVNNRCHKHWRW